MIFIDNYLLNSYDESLKIEPNNFTAWLNKGIAFDNLK